MWQAWVVVMERWGRSLLQCPMMMEQDERTLCLPRIVKSALSPEEVAALLASTTTEKAWSRDEGGRLESVDVADTVWVERVANASFSSMRCGRRVQDREVTRAVVARYREGEDLDQHVDESLFEVVVPLGRSRVVGVRFPEYVDALPPRLAAQCRGEEPPTLPFLRELPPPPSFSGESFGASMPLFPYAKMCPPTCLSETCDDHLVRGEALARLEGAFGCDCTLCKETNASRFRENEDFEFEGGGTIFSSLRDVTFFPEVGDALVHGARLKHGADRVTSGVRRVLVLSLDDGLCLDGREHFNVAFTSIIVILLVPTLLCFWLFADFDDFDDDSSDDAGRTRRRQSRRRHSKGEKTLRAT